MYPSEAYKKKLEHDAKIKNAISRKMGTNTDSVKSILKTRYRKK